MSTTIDAVETEFVELYALYGFGRSVMVELDQADFEWLETNANGVIYSRNREDVPSGMWVANGFKFEVLDVRLVSPLDPRVGATAEGPRSYLLRDL